MRPLFFFLSAVGGAAVLSFASAAAAGGDLRLREAEVQGSVVVAPSTDGRAEELTLVPALQSRIEQILRESRAPAGAIVLSDVKTGRILAWASRGEDRDLVRVPAYPGASIFKVVTAAALLEGEHVHRPTPQCFGGGIRSLSLDDVSHLCRSGEDKIPFGEALGHSVNVVFGRLAVAHLDAPVLTKTAAELGLDGDVPLDVKTFPNEIAVPDDTLGLARTAAGFSDEGVSPLGALFVMHTIANKGERVRLRIRAGAGDDRRVTDGRAISETTANALVRMLEVTTRSGTSREAFQDKPGRPNLRVAGKTGTLAVRKPERLVTWFAGFAPSRDPEVAISVMLANDPKWWRKANEVARDSLDAYFAAQRVTVARNDP